MPQDIWRFAWVGIVATLFGVATGHPALILLLTAAALLIWYYQQLILLLRWLEDRKNSPAPDPSGVFESICREIDYLRARHKRRKRKLSLVLKQFQDATTALPDAMVILSPEGEIIWANAAAAEFLGVRWPDDAKQRLSNLVRHPAAIELLANPEPHEQTLEIPSPEKPGVVLSVRVVPYAEEQRLFVARDITRLHRLSEMRRDFVANVSHELRTPLTVVSGYVQTLRADEARCPPEWKSVLEHVHGQTERMNNVIRDLLLLSRLEQEDRPVADDLISVAEMLGRIQGEAQLLSGERRHMFYLEVDPTLQLLGEAGEIYSAFSNLIINAVQYTPERGVIRIKWYRDSAGAHFSVEDNGIGIPVHHLPRITERFYRVDHGRSRETGGTGLGLAIVKHVLNRHQATLFIDSTPGEGAQFRCDFPPSRIAAVTTEPVEQSAEMS